MSKDCKERKYNNKKKNKKAEAVDGDDNDWYYVCSQWRLKKVKKKFGSWRMLKCLQRQVCCGSLMVTHFFVHQKQVDWRLGCILLHHK